MQQELQKLDLPELNYSPNALEPVLIGDILLLHHQKHHRKYVDNYNTLVEKLVDSAYKKDTLQVQKIAPKVKFNAGGHNCHAMYWENLAPQDNGGGVLPDDKSLLTKAIVNEWGSYDNFIKQFKTKTGAIEGSGWGWLAIDPTTKVLSIETTQNQDHVEAGDRVALLTIDAWEHAFYLQYKNDKVSYLDQIWNVVNWRCVEERFHKVIL